MTILDQNAQIESTSSLYLFSFLNELQTRYENGENHEARFLFFYNEEQQIFGVSPYITEYDTRSETYFETDDEINAQFFEVDLSQVEELFEQFLEYMESIKTSEEDLGFNLSEFSKDNFMAMVMAAMTNPTNLRVGFDITMAPGELLLKHWLTPVLENDTIDVIVEHVCFYYPEIKSETLTEAEASANPEVKAIYDDMSLGELVRSHFE